MRSLIHSFILMAVVLVPARATLAEAPPQKTVIFEGTGADALACGPVLGIAPNGNWLCAWLGGGRAEPKPENKTVVAISADGGVTWSKPVTIVPRASTVLNLYTIGDRVCAIGFEYGPASNYTIKRPFRLFSSDNGQTWTEPEYFQVERQNVAIESHIVLDNGDWLFPAYFMEPRETPLEGGTRREYTHTIGCGVLISPDAGSTFLADASGTIAFHGSIDNRPLGLHEPRLAQLSTGRVLMLMRANFDGRIWQAHSDDHGRTWSSAEPTAIPNPSAKVWIGRLGDGRIGLALNPATDKRDPLELWISDDDAKTWSSKLHLDEYSHYEHLTKLGERHDPEAGWGKGGAWPGNLSYPFVLVREQIAHVVYDVARRDVVLLRVPLTPR